MHEIFDEIFKMNGWKNEESLSGPGSTMAETAQVRRGLPGLFQSLGVKSVLDIPCGDFHWMSKVKFAPDLTYIGGDIVMDLIRRNRTLYPDVDFRLLDITTDDLPVVDLILCRDLLGHFSNIDVKRALYQIKESGARYLLATTFPDRKNEGNILTGQWRPINLASMFGLGEPLAVYNEGSNGEFSDKSLGLWDLMED